MQQLVNASCLQMDWDDPDQCPKSERQSMSDVLLAERSSSRSWIACGQSPTSFGCHGHSAGVTQVTQVTEDSRKFLSSEPAAAGGARPSVKQRYVPEEDEYEVQTALVLVPSPLEDILRAKRRQLLALRGRIKRGGEFDTLNHYEAVAREIQAEVE
ncbi:unnamed protein product, partial [Effrenium voratum]